MRANEREVLDLMLASDGPQATRDLLPRCRIISDATDLSRAIYNLRRMLLVEEADRIAAPGSKALVKRYRATALAHTLPAEAAAPQACDNRQDQLPAALDELPDEEREIAWAEWRNNAQSLPSSAVDETSADCLEPPDPVLGELADLVIVAAAAPPLPNAALHATRLRALARVLPLPPISADTIAATHAWLYDLADLIDQQQREEQP